MHYGFGQRVALAPSLILALTLALALTLTLTQTQTKLMHHGVCAPR
jgi:hypothetical protein